MAIPFGVGLEVGELAVLVGVALVLVADRIGVRGLAVVARETRVVVGIRPAGLKKQRSARRASADHPDAQLAHQRVVALFHAPVVEPVAGHPEQEIGVAAILPGKKAAGDEGWAVRSRRGRRKPLDARHFLVQRAGGEPAAAQPVQQVVGAVERADTRPPPATSVTRRPSTMARLDAIAFRAELRQLFRVHPRAGASRLLVGSRRARRRGSSLPRPQPHRPPRRNRWRDPSCGGGSAAAPAPRNTPCTPRRPTRPHRSNSPGPPPRQPLRPRHRVQDSQRSLCSPPPRASPQGGQPSRERDHPKAVHPPTPT